MRQILVALQGDTCGEHDMAPVQEAWQSGTYRRLLFHVYSGIASEAATVQVARSLQAQFPKAHIVGTMSAGEIMNGRLMPRGVLVGALLFESANV